MRKQECVHLHALFHCVTRHLFEQEDVPTEIFADYYALDTRPVDIAKSKQSHRDAAVELASAIETGLEQVPPDRPGVPTTERA